MDVHAFPRASTTFGSSHMLTRLEGGAQTPTTGGACAEQRTKTEVHSGDRSPTQTLTGNWYQLSRAFAPLSGHPLAPPAMMDPLPTPQAPAAKHLIPSCRNFKSSMVPPSLHSVEECIKFAAHSHHFWPTVQRHAPCWISRSRLRSDAAPLLTHSHRMLLPLISAHLTRSDIATMPTNAKGPVPVSDL